MLIAAYLNSKYKVALSMIAGAALGATAMQGLHAQAKLKAYSVGEIERIGFATRLSPDSPQSD